MHWRGDKPFIKKAVKCSMGLFALAFLAACSGGPTEQAPSVSDFPAITQPMKETESPVLTGDGTDWVGRTEDLIPAGEVRMQYQMKLVMEDETISDDTRIKFYVMDMSYLYDVDGMEQFKEDGFDVSEIEDYPACMHFGYTVIGTKGQIKGIVGDVNYACELSLAGP